MRKVIVFDIGNVVLFTKWERAGQFLEEKCGIASNRVVNLFWGNGWGGRALEHFLNLNEGTDEQFYTIAQRELGVGISESVFWKMWNSHWELNESVVAIIKRLAQLPEPPVLAVCSNINGPHWIHICEKYQFMSVFTIAALSYRVGKMKPDWAMFSRVVGRFPDYPTLFIDDRVDNVEAAVKFGWQGHHYRQGWEENLQVEVERFLNCKL